MEFKIENVLVSGELREKLISYARECSFQNTGSFLSELLSDKSSFEDYEEVLAVVIDDEIIGFGALLKECCCIYEEENSPWLDFLFVEEKFRNLHIGIKLVEKICEKAKAVGFESVYLCTLSHIGYYHKLGFEIIYSTYNYNNTMNEKRISVMKKSI